MRLQMADPQLIEVCLSTSEASLLQRHRNAADSRLGEGVGFCPGSHGQRGRSFLGVPWSGELALKASPWATSALFLVTASSGTLLASMNEAFSGRSHLPGVPVLAFDGRLLLDASCRSCGAAT